MTHKIASTANRPSNVYQENNIETLESAVATHSLGTIMIGNIEVKINEVQKFDELDPREPAMEQQG